MIKSIPLVGDGHLRAVVKHVKQNVHLFGDLSPISMLNGVDDGFLDRHLDMKQVTPDPSGAFQRSHELIDHRMAGFQIARQGLVQGPR